MVFDTGSDTDRHALERLQTDMIGWLTTVRADGQPQTFPIWFLWDGEEALIYSDRRARRNANIAANPRSPRRPRAAISFAAATVDKERITFRISG